MLEVERLVESQWSTAFLTASFAVTLLIWWRTSGENEKKFPGPRGLPLIGNMIEFGRNVGAGKWPEYQEELHQKHGPYVSIQVGVQKIIFINDGELLAELFQKEDFTFRPIETLPTLTRISHGSPRGLIFGNGEPHKEMRRFTLLSLRDFGVGKKSIDEMIQTEASILSQHLATMAESKDGVMSDLKIKMQYATANVIHHVIFGYRQDYDDPKWKELVGTLYAFFSVNPLAFPENFFPILGKVPFINNYLSGDKYETYYGANSAMEKYLDHQIEDHRATYVEDEIRDFIDLYLKYEKEQREFYFKENIFATMLDLFRAGTDTTATTLTWAIMYLAKNPDTQELLRAEVDEVVGDGVFSRKDKDQLVKTRAFINEVHRYVTIAPTAPPHTVNRSMALKDYTVQPGDIIFASLFAMHHDKDYWEDPYTFRIDRWINGKGELMKHDGHFFPFSTGKRACPGRQLANIEVILILVEFLQRFKFGVAEGYDDMRDEQNTGLIRAPQNFHVKVDKRY